MPVFQAFKIIIKMLRTSFRCYTGLKVLIALDRALDWSSIRSIVVADSANEIQ